MPDATWTPDSPGPSRSGDGWGPSTPIRTSEPASQAGPTRSPSRALEEISKQVGRKRSSRDSAPAAYDPNPGEPAPIGGWTPAPPAQEGSSAGFENALQVGATPAADAVNPQANRARASARRRIEAMSASKTGERGAAGWLALLVLVVVTLIGLLIDGARGVNLGTGFNVGIIAGSVLAILVVRRSGMFPVVVAPPIVYSLGAGISLYLRSDGLAKRNVLIDAAANWLVYGFPAIASATAAVLIIAGIRLIVRR